MVLFAAVSSNDTLIIGTLTEKISATIVVHYNLSFIDSVTIGVYNETTWVVCYGRSVRYY